MAVEINHQGREEHKDFATGIATYRTSKIQAGDTDLILARLFTLIAACLLMIGRRQ
jgi:hypothetical protein